MISANEFFTAVENRRAVADSPEWLDALVRAHDAELAHRVREGTAALESATVPAGPFVAIRALLRLRLLVRGGDGDAISASLDDIRALAADGDAPATQARAYHLLSVALTRLGRIEDAELAVARGLALVDAAAVARTWMLDTVAQIWIAQGAWVEAIRTLRALVDLRRRAGDTLGVAISAGHLARVALQLGRAAEAAEVARDALSVLDQTSSIFTRIRLQTLLVSALLECDAGATLDAEARTLESWVEESRGETHYLRGYAALTLATIAARRGDGAGAAAWLADARTTLTLGSQLTLLRHHEATIDPTRLDDERWRASFEAMCAAMEAVTEGEILVRNAIVERTFDRDRAAARAQLTIAYDRATASNNPLWLRWVDTVAGRLAPDLHADRVAMRFAGRNREELERTHREEVSIVFSDLVSFTPRSLELPPEEVMETVRGLFELAVPVMARHRVTPLSYLGDGLLAIARGPAHARRALEFARELVARSARVTTVRKQLGTRWGLDVRAGVASGPCVLGSIGSLLKTDIAAIGLTTNLAARLQGEASPCEVVAAATTVEAAYPASDPASAAESAERPVLEHVRLKGFEQLVKVYRYGLPAAS